MNIVQFDTIPNDDEIANEIKACRHYKYLVNDSLLKDLWSIVFSFLFGYTDSLMISVPLRAISLEMQDGSALLLHYSSYLSYFYGWEDTGELHLFRPDKLYFKQHITVSGHYPLAFAYHTKTLLYVRGDLDRRVLVQMMFDPVQMPQPPEEMYFVWHTSCTTTFFKFWTMWYFQEDNTHLDRESKDVLPVLTTKNGELSW